MPKTVMRVWKNKRSRLELMVQTESSAVWMQTPNSSVAEKRAIKREKNSTQVRIQILTGTRKMGQIVSKWVYMESFQHWLNRIVKWRFEVFLFSFFFSPRNMIVNIERKSQMRPASVGVYNKHNIFRCVNLVFWRWSLEMNVDRRRKGEKKNSQMIWLSFCFCALVYSLMCHKVTKNMLFLKLL